MHGLASLWAPWLVTNLVGLALVGLAFVRPRDARWAFGGLFALASVANAAIALTDPRSYVDGFAPFATPAYRAFIQGDFAAHVVPFVSSIALGQAVVAGMILRGGRWLTRGAFAAVLFLVAISPLGLGAAFPSTLLMALAIAVTAMQLDDRFSGAASDATSP